MLKRVLIANRGEIAIRIARAAAGLGIESMAVYAPADAKGLHTRIATDNFALRGPATADAIAPYLNIDGMVEAAAESGCDAVHPGYGFLSESAPFAERCAEQGLVFVGPSPEALQLFGDKTRARALADKLSIPTITGSEVLVDAGHAASEAARIGYPVMLKAAGGGGGRGMRVVRRAEEMPEAFERAQGEAAGAFGRGEIFLEQLVERPRHIEVQVLADGQGNVVHLFERDCSVQSRHQKVVEIAPAVALAEDIRAQMHADAVKLVSAAGYTSAGTVEFLVSPERGTYFFIECNPRIQVEHTITEQVLGVDLVEAQLRIAGGATLADLGLAAQADVGEPRGFAVQSRVVVRSAGTITAYKEPGGRGVRIDGHGYAGYAPPAQYDPLLAKVVVQSSSLGTLASALARSEQALAAFHIQGVDTNLSQLRAIVTDPSVASGDARTTLMGERDEFADATRAAAHSATVQLLEECAAPARSAPIPETFHSLDTPPGHTAVECPMGGTMDAIQTEVGQRVNAGDVLLVVSAMKMQASVSAPCAGIVTDLLELSVGQSVGAGQILAVLKPDEAGTAGADLPRDQTWAPVMHDVAALHQLALNRFSDDSIEPGVVRQRNRGKLTCRERIDLLLDEGSFREVGSMAGFASYDDEGEVAAFTPANHVGGWGRINDRKSIVCADDFTSRGGHADGAIGQKSRYLDSLSVEIRVPSIRLLDGSSGGGSVATMVPKQAEQGDSTAKESTGAISSGRPRVTGTGGSFLPGHLGSTLYTEQLNTVPVVNMLLGSVVGIGAAKAVLGHFSVMVKDIAQLFVAGPPVVSHAMGYDITKEDLGGWHIHCTNGSVDNLAESEEEAMALTRRFLSYLPSSTYEAPPVTDCSDDPDRREDELFTMIPRIRTSTFDVRKVIRLLADRDSFFEIGPLWGTDQVTGFVRFNGYPMGVIASDSRHENGGALTADGCDKLIRHLDLCDLFHLPVLNLVDNPGFAVGLEHEMRGTIRKGGEWMVAFSQVNVPIFSVLMRRSFGVAGNNYATPRARPSVRVVWPAADVGGIPPEGGIEAAYKRQLAEAEDPAAFRAELNARIESARGPVGPLNRFEMEEMIDPRDTRSYVCDWVAHAFAAATHPDRLRPRQLQFRP